MAAMVRIGPAQSQEPRTPSRTLRWIAGAKVLRPSSVFQDVLAESGTEARLAETGTSTLIWDASVAVGA